MYDLLQTLLQAEVLAKIAKTVCHPPAPGLELKGFGLHPAQSTDGLRAFADFLRTFPPHFLLLALLPHILMARKKPSATLAWVWFALLFPYAGCFAYLLLGSIPKSHRSKTAPLSPSRSRRKPTQRLPVILERLTGNAPSRATRFTLHDGADSFYQRLSQRVEKSRSEVLFQTFVWRPDPVGLAFLKVLSSAAKRGVYVRLLLDPIGSLELKETFLSPLHESGGRFAWFRPPSLLARLRHLNLRNHRKLQIIDGSVAFVGGMNMGEEHLPHQSGKPVWRDLQAEVEGPVVSQLRNRFAADWRFATREEIPDALPTRMGRNRGSPCQILEGCPDPATHGLHGPLIALLNHARRRLWIATGYFAPSEPLLCALEVCAARGVDVRLLISEKSDHPYLVLAGRSYYEELLCMGVRVYEYSKAIHHTKALLMDSSWVLIGSANCDHRSLYHNFELGLLQHCRRTAQKLESILSSDFKESREITPPDFARRPLRARFMEALLRPLTPLF
jgi:cardiolipin synthase